MSGVRWDRVDALIDTSPGLEDLRAHGLHLLAARRWRATGRAIPPELAREEVAAARRVHSAPEALRDIRRICSGPLMLVKGPAVAVRFPDPAARPFVDIDLLVPNPERVQRELLDAGYRYADDPAHYPEHLHHLPPVYAPPGGPAIEVHGRLKWVEVLEPPSFEELADDVEPDALGVEGMWAPSAVPHALLLAGHLWAHDPLTRLLRLLDIAVMAEPVDPVRLESLAARWGMSRLWRATRAVNDALFGDARTRPLPLRTWARALPEAREPTVAELHLGRLLGPFSAYPPWQASRALAAALAGFVRPHDGETWGRKLRRTADQIAHPGMRRSEHVGDLTSDPGPTDRR